jgi:hypothetical protein
MGSRSRAVLLFCRPDRPEAAILAKLENVSRTCCVRLTCDHFEGAIVGRCDYQLTIPYRAEPDDSDLDAEVNHLQVEMLNIAEGFRCSIETYIREVGGAERAW